MDEKISKSDYEMISDYLDQNLSDEQISLFAHRLSENPDLSRETAELMRVKTLIRDYPVVNPPHNYILTTIEAREARKPSLLERLFPFFRAAAVFCCLALVLSFVFPMMLSSRESSYVSKSLDLDSMEAAEADAAVFESDAVVADYEVKLFSDREGAGGAVNASMPSHGVRGGTPKNEFLLQSQRMLPEDNAFQPGMPDEVIQLEESLPAVPDTAEVNPLPIVRTACLLLLAVSAVWVLLTLIRRSHLKVRE